MARFAEKYSQRERDAMAEAVVDARIAPRRVVELAARGELHDGFGAPLEPFETNATTIRDLARRLRRRRAGLEVSALAAEPHRDAIEKLRRRLISVADVQLAAYRRPSSATRQRPTRSGSGRSSAASVRPLHCRIATTRDRRRPAPVSVLNVVGRRAAARGEDPRGAQHGAEARVADDPLERLMRDVESIEREGRSRMPAVDESGWNVIRREGAVMGT